MSALLMVPASGQHRLIKDQRKNRLAKHDTYPLTRSGSSRSSRSSSTSKQSIFSLGSVLGRLWSKKPGEFDAKKLKTLSELLDTTYDKKVWEFDYKLDILANKVWNHSQNEAINLFQINEERFISPTTVNTLRYTYFERFKDSYEPIAEHLNLLPKPEYWAKVWDRDAYNHCHLFGASCKKNLIVVDQALVKKNTKDRRSAYRAIKGACKVEAYEEEPDRQTSIRKLWHTPAFWDNVFYDIRSASEKENFGEWLPPVEVVQRFFISLTDYALLNFHVLDCTVDEAEKENMNEKETNTLSRQYFYYFNDLDYAYFDMLARVFNETFMLLMRIFFPEEEVAEKTEQVMKILVETICSNLQISYFGGQGVDAVLQVWQDFMLLALQRLVIANIQEETPSKIKPLPKAPAEENPKPKQSDEGTPRKAKPGFFARLRR